MARTSKMTVEETLATPSSFRFEGDTLVTVAEMAAPAGDWPQQLGDEKLIQTKQPTNFYFKWKVSGALVPLLSRENRWKIQLYFEKWGQTEFNIGAVGTQTVGFVPVSGNEYNVAISIPSNTVPEGIYDVVAVLRLADQFGKPLPVAGFAEFGKIEYYQAD